MVKKLMVLILTLVLLVSLSAACTGPAGSAGAAGAAGSAGPAGAAGEPGTPASTASLVVTPASGPGSTKITISGAGFVPGEEVDLVLEVEGIENLLGQKTAKGPVFANEYGAFTTTSIIGKALAPDVYVIQARGDKGTIAFHPLQKTGEKYSF